MSSKYHWHNQIWDIQKFRGEKFEDIEEVFVSWYMDEDGQHLHNVKLDRDKAWNFFVKYNPPTIIYTTNTIIFTVTYDGDQWLSWVPRNPESDLEVGTYGGG